MGEFKNVFRQLRIAAGLTQDELAKKTGISRSTIGMYETGKREPSYDVLDQLADFFNVDADFLLGRTDKTTVLPQTVGEYYLSKETARFAQECFENPDLKALFNDRRHEKILKLNLDDKEIGLIENYRTLDSFGKEVIDKIMDVEYRRCTEHLTAVAAHAEGSISEEQQKEIEKFKELVKNDAT